MTHKNPDVLAVGTIGFKKIKPDGKISPMCHSWYFSNVWPFQVLEQSIIWQTQPMVPESTHGYWYHLKILSCSKTCFSSSIEFYIWIEKHFKLSTLLWTFFTKNYLTDLFCKVTRKVQLPSTAVTQVVIEFYLKQFILISHAFNNFLNSQFPGSRGIMQFWQN